MIDLKDLEYSELCDFVENLGEKKFHAKQIFSWLSKGIEDFDEMTDISKELREKLKAKSHISKLEIRKKLVSEIDKTTKYLFGLEDGNCIESVVMYYNHGITICVSSEVGCLMGCRFCASTIGGKVRNLTCGEILNQIIFAEKDLGERIGNIVIMGIGEPLDNFENVVKFLHNVNNPNGLNIGYRHISLSTCGIVPKIYELAKQNLPITLSVSLHAPNNKIRDSIMPINSKYKIEELITACKDYIKATNRRVSFEYALISGVNDSLENADELSKLLSKMLIHVNLIPVNNIEERDYKSGNKQQIRAFCERLNKNGINATVRRELGRDINASCGQLRRKNEKG
ncbi:MAG: 23S rRNA (adenine(2503)-C(2))-methyltransferase RlmN [Clostridia bacterium]|nr:23S rRNA (adenine(2503)-C(2))-methyltransferase RlmN [Clostridia bacterium]MBQ7751918.1 23S rRNA (adenine(2503)-C(2))-methyltransferase RlmN [Clostridia bacterium]